MFGTIGVWTILINCDFQRQNGTILTASLKKIYSVVGGVAKGRRPIRNIFVCSQSQFNLNLTHVPRM